jgi:hypothetical protein
VGDETVTWTEWALLFLVGERGFTIAYGVYLGASAALRELDAPADKTLPMPDSLDIASDDVVALDYSSRQKRH